MRPPLMGPHMDDCPGMGDYVNRRPTEWNETCSQAPCNHEANLPLSVEEALRAELAVVKQERNALAAALEEAHRRIEAGIESLHRNVSTVDHEAHLLQQIVDDVIGTRGVAVLAARDKRMKAEGSIEALEGLGCTCSFGIGNCMLPDHSVRCAVKLAAAKRKEEGL